ncbi:Transmembrane protein [Quillaja saponaria]|uniref:Transmembrane protein n=1 Tax=Quillaja saponaria TaxID=32244 RepID=A0AAD7VD49_QUISA|nr:Transmembrane protein [Quillaja saponaria]
MKSLNSVGLGLSIIFGCLLLALVAELYYLLWWKKRITNTEIENVYSCTAREVFYMFCWNRPSSLRHRALNPQELCSSMRITDTLVHEPEGQLQTQTSDDFLFKPFGDDEMEAEFMRQHNLSGPPRFLFTIMEETTEDLESEDGRSKGGNGSRGRRLGDFLFTMETPYLTPMTSPSLFTPPLTPMNTYNQQGFNPHFESASDAEFNKMKSSPPPKFKFLQNAEEKLRRKFSEEVEEKVHKTNKFVQDIENKTPPSNFPRDEIDGSFISIIVDKNKDEEINHHSCPAQYHSSTSQVLPLATSPASIFRSPVHKN